MASTYGRNLGICVDLWGPDVGPHFTRLWGFPGHSPEEFRSALLFSHYLAPDLNFVENVDVLTRFDGIKFQLTEYGEIYRNFIAENGKSDLGYRHLDAECVTAVIRSDDLTVTVK